MSAAAPLEASELLKLHPDTLLNANQASVVLGGLAVRTLQKWRWEGKGPKYVKVGRRAMYRLRDLSDYIGAQTRSSTSDPGPVAGARQSAGGRRQVGLGLPG